MTNKDENSKEDLAVPVPSEILERIQENPDSVIVVEATSQFSGPVPSPERMHQYGEIDDSFPDRFVQMAEEEQKHRHKLENSAMDKEYRLQHWGHIVGLILGLIGIIAIIIIALKAPPAVGVTAVGAVSTVVGIALFRRAKKDPPESTPDSDIEK